jgi:rod shape-determining protein MreC
MRDVPQQIKVKTGDSVFTTSYSFFPPDIMIGIVFKTETVKKNNLQLLYLKPSTNFRDLQYVYVVENRLDRERTQLEDSLKSKP